MKPFMSVPPLPNPSFPCLLMTRLSLLLSTVLAMFLAHPCVFRISFVHICADYVLPCVSLYCLSLHQFSLYRLLPLSTSVLLSLFKSMPFILKPFSSSTSSASPLYYHGLLESFVLRHIFSKGFSLFTTKPYREPTS